MSDPIEDLKRDLLATLDRHVAAAKTRIAELEARKAELAKQIDEWADEAIADLESSDG